MIFVEHVKADLQMALPSWVIKFIMSTFYPKIFQDLPRVVASVQSGKKGFKQLMKEDVTGLYALIRKMQEENPNPVVKDGRDATGLKCMFKKYI